MFVRMFACLFAVCALISAVAGCASGPRYATVAPQIPDLAPGLGRILVYWYRSPSGELSYPDILIDNQPVGDLRPRTFAFHDVPAGVRTVTMSGDDYEYEIAAGETKYIEIAREVVQMGVVVNRYKLRPRVVLEQQALRDLPKLHYVGDHEQLTTAP